MINDCCFIGNLTKDPAVKFTPNGQAVCNFDIACNEKWKDKDGQPREAVEYVKVVVWGKQAESCGQYLSKGRPAYVRGKMRTRSYEKDGVKHWVTEIVADTVKFLGGGNRDQASQPAEEEMPF